MTGMKRNRARAADIAVWAPLVLLPFVWFALGACIELDADEVAVVGPKRPDGQYGNTPVYNYPDYTQYGQNVVCTGTGGYGGGNDAELAATRASIANEVESHNRAISDLNAKIRRCEGKEVTNASVDAKHGCNRAVQAASYGNAGRPPTPEMQANVEPCRQADRELTNPATCRQGDVESARNLMFYHRNQLAIHQPKLQNVDACIADKKRREDAARRPQLDPNAVLGIMQGIGRRPSGGGYSGGSSQHGNHKH